MGSKSILGVWDWVIFAVVCFVPAIIGVVNGVRQRHRQIARDFLVGTRDMNVVPVSISIVASLLSAVFILGVSAEMYTQGTEFFLTFFGNVLAVIVTCHVFIPLLYPLNLTSVYEYLEKRFQSKAVKTLGTVFMIVQQVVFIGLACFAPSTALEAVTNIPAWATIISIVSLVTFYSFLGGIQAVIWTSVFNSVIMVAGLTAVVIQGTIVVGGMVNVFEINHEWNRVQLFNFNPNPTERYTVWSLIFGTMVNWTANFGVGQASVQRYCSLPNMRKAKIAVYLVIAGWFLLIVATCLAGVVVFAHYANLGCDPLRNNDITNANQIIPYFVIQTLGYPAVPGLFVACLYSASLSATSSCMNALAVVTWQDILQPCLKQTKQHQHKLITRMLVVFYGLCGIGMGLLSITLGGTVVQINLSFTGAVNGPLLGMFVLGACFPCANWIGTIAGAVSGFIVTFWMSVGSYASGIETSYLDSPVQNCKTHHNDTSTEYSITYTSTSSLLPETHTLDEVSVFYKISFLWYPAIGVITTAIIGLLVSLFTGPSEMNDVDSQYIIPVLHRIYVKVLSRQGKGNKAPSRQYDTCTVVEGHKTRGHPSVVNGLEKEKDYPIYTNPPYNKETRIFNSPLTLHRK